MNIMIKKIKFKLIPVNMISIKGNIKYKTQRIRQTSHIQAA